MSTADAPDFPELLNRLERALATHLQPLAALAALAAQPTRTVQVPADAWHGYTIEATTEPTRLVGADLSRLSVLIKETTGSPVGIAVAPSESEARSAPSRYVVPSTGLELPTRGDVWVVALSGTATVNVLILSQLAGGPAPLPI